MKIGFVWLQSSVLIIYLLCKRNKLLLISYLIHIAPSSELGLD